MVQVFHLLMSVVLVFSQHYSHFLVMKVKEKEKENSSIETYGYFLAGAHLAEETRGAGRAGEFINFEKKILFTIFFFFAIAPKGIVGTCVCSAIVGFIYLLALLFAIPNVETFVENNSGDNASSNLAVSVYQLAVPSRGAMALTVILIINLYFAGMSSLTVTSRIGYIYIGDSFLSMILFN